MLTQYYPPEIGAPQNRLHELALRLKNADIDVEVLTAMPNYPKMEIYEAYKNNKIVSEKIDGIQVYRSKIYVSKSKNILARLLNYFSFVWTSYRKGRKLKTKYDYIFVESPPLFLGYSAMALAKKLKTKLIFNVSDLWPESAEKLNIVNNKRLLKVAYNLEAKCYRRSVLITGQTEGIVENIKMRFPETKSYWLPNGVDLEYYNPDKYTGSDFRLKHNFAEDDLLFFYGGILGHAQGLEVILNAAKEITDAKVHFILQGAGPEKDKLLGLKNALSLQNVHFLNPVSKNEMPDVLKSVDVALIPLKKLELFLGAIPSKIFEALAMKKALLLGVEGEAKKHFIDKAHAGLFFEPENIPDLVKQIEYLSKHKNEIKTMGENGRSYVNEHFNRNKIANDFIEVLKKL